MTTLFIQHHMFLFKLCPISSFAVFPIIKNSLLNLIFSYFDSHRIGCALFNVFEIYAAGKRYGGFANNLGYQEKAITLVTNSKWANNTFGKSVYADVKFAIGALSVPFAAVDYLALSKMPDFFDNGSTQQLLLGYNALQTNCYSYVAEQGVNWYDHMLTTEKVAFSETITAISIPTAGITQRKSKDRHVVISTTYYANANQAAKLLATGNARSIYHVQYLKYYANGSLKKTINFNTFDELYSIFGL